MENKNDIKLVPLTQTQIDVLLAILDSRLAESRESLAIIQSMGIKLPENQDCLAHSRKIYKEIENVLEQEKPKDIINAWTIPLAFSIINQPVEYYGTATWASALFYLRGCAESSVKDNIIYKYDPVDTSKPETEPKSSAKDMIVTGVDAVIHGEDNKDCYISIADLNMNNIEGAKIVLHCMDILNAKCILKKAKDILMQNEFITVKEMKTLVNWPSIYPGDDWHGWRDLTMAFIAPQKKSNRLVGLYLPKIIDLTKE